MMRDYDDNIIEMNIKKEGSKLERQVKMVGDIVKKSAMNVLEDKNKLGWATGIGLMHGLKYKGSLSQGIKGGLSAYAMFIFSESMFNVIDNKDKIKKA